MKDKDSRSGNNLVRGTRGTKWPPAWLTEATETPINTPLMRLEAVVERAKAEFGVVPPSLERVLLIYLDVARARPGAIESIERCMADSVRNVRGGEHG